MELQEFDLEQKEFDIPLDDPKEEEQQPRRRPRRRRRKPSRWRYLLLIPALAAVVLIILLIVNWTAVSVRFSPGAALARSVEHWKRLPDPGSYGVLGKVSWEGTEADCSGTLQLETTDDGLALWIEGASLSGPEADMEFSCYLSPHDAVLCSPSLTGGSAAYLGVSLDESILAQTAGTGGDPEYGWYYNEEAIARFQRAADEVRTALASVSAGDLSPAEREAVARFAQELELTAVREDGGFRLSAQADADHMAELISELGLGLLFPGEKTDLIFTLNGEAVLTAISAESKSVSLYLDLGGDPTSYLAPRIEVNVRDEGRDRWGAILAITVEKGQHLEPPAYRNAFTLLPREGEEA